MAATLLSPLSDCCSVALEASESEMTPLPAGAWRRVHPGPLLRTHDRCLPLRAQLQTRRGAPALAGALPTGVLAFHRGQRDALHVLRMHRGKRTPFLSSFHRKNIRRGWTNWLVADRFPAGLTLHGQKEMNGRFGESEGLALSCLSARCHRQA